VLIHLLIYLFIYDVGLLLFLGILLFGAIFVLFLLIVTLLLFGFARVLPILLWLRAVSSCLAFAFWGAFDITLVRWRLMFVRFAFLLRVVLLTFCFFAASLCRLLPCVAVLRYVRFFCKLFF
jgi:hypothetical protein